MILSHEWHIEVVSNHNCLLGEGPVWDARRQTILWVDILRGEIHVLEETGRNHRRTLVQEMVGAVALCKDGHFIAALKSGLAFVNRTTGQVHTFAHPEAHLTENRFNDGKCDPAGRFWVGTMALSEAAGAGNLYRVDADLRVTMQIPVLSVSNGLAWSRDHSIFYFIDSPLREVVAFDYDIATGAICNKRRVIAVPQEDGFPDGMTIDSEGMLWVAHWDGWQVARWDPATGKKLLSISLPVARVTSCTFGGAGLNDLYITSASVGLSKEQLTEQPLAGALFVIRNCGFQGMEAFEFDHSTPFQPL